MKTNRLPSSGERPRSASTRTARVLICFRPSTGSLQIYTCLNVDRDLIGRCSRELFPARPGLSYYQIRSTRHYPKSPASSLRPVMPSLPARITFLRVIAFHPSPSTWRSFAYPLGVYNRLVGDFLGHAGGNSQPATFPTPSKNGRAFARIHDYQFSSFRKSRCPPKFCWRAS